MTGPQPLTDNEIADLRVHLNEGNPIGTEIRLRLLATVDAERAENARLREAMTRAAADPNGSASMRAFLRGALDGTTEADQ